MNSVLRGVLAPLLFVLFALPSAADEFHVRSSTCEPTPAQREKLAYVPDDLKPLLEEHRQRAQRCFYAKLASGTFGLLILERGLGVPIPRSLAARVARRQGYTLSTRSFSRKRQIGEWFEGDPPEGWFAHPFGHGTFVGLLQGVSVPLEDGPYAVTFLVWWRDDRKMVTDSDVNRFLDALLVPLTRPAP